MAKGRKRKQGTRTKSGQLSRAGQPRHDKGNDRIASMRERFGEHYASPIGRAFAAGLLGDGMEAKVRLDTGKRFSRLYSAIIAQGGYRCPLGRETLSQGFTGEIMAHQRAMEDQEWLFAAMERLDREGLRVWFDQITSPIYHDSGPYWLDSLLNGGKDPADLMVLKVAIKAIDCIAPKVRAATIRVAA